ncbi:MAG: arsenate reductase ArsC [Bryobacterales bacterium]|nr:arsenate reductase ArsC [Bryobacterales bacterium]MDE0628291.1 arsenate reductase ArsC [Bryobacterales bacterium]
MKSRVLILCTGNSCRSQMAEGLLRFMAADRIEAYSAGTDPHGIHPDAVVAMDEMGIDIRGHESEHVDTYLGFGIDTVITVCERASSNCPTFPERVGRVHWSFDDPASAQGGDEERRAVFRRVRDEIAASLRSWLDKGCPA